MSFAHPIADVERDDRYARDLHDQDAHDFHQLPAADPAPAPSPRRGSVATAADTVPSRAKGYAHEACGTGPADIAPGRDNDRPADFTALLNQAASLIDHAKTVIPFVHPNVHAGVVYDLDRAVSLTFGAVRDIRREVGA